MTRLAPVHQVAVTETSYGNGRGGRPWRRKRARVLERDSFCCKPCEREGKLTVATQVDHVIPKAEGGSDDDDNLQAICDPCHEAKSQKEAGRGRHRSA